MILTSCRTGIKRTTKNRLCQDRYLVTSDGQTTVLAVADGHGSPQYVRSGLGARIACHVAKRVLLDDSIQVENRSRELKKRFDQMVEKHMRFHPFTEFEREKIQSLEDLRYAYGTTLIAAKLTASDSFFLHLGDGELHVIRQDGQFLPRLNPEEGDYTGSVCSLVQASACDHIYTAWYPEPMAVVIMYTDGYDCRQTYPWALVDLCTHPDPASQIDGILDLGNGSGDDQTLAFYADGDACTREPYISGLNQERARCQLKQEINKLTTSVGELESYLKLMLRKMEHLSADALEVKRAIVMPRMELYRKQTQKLEELWQVLKSMNRD